MLSSATKLAVVGNWHQAAVVSACFADMGHQVTGVGSDPSVIAQLNAGHAPLYEHGLDDLIRRSLDTGRLRYTNNYADGLQGVDFCFLCIDTPVGPNDESDLVPIHAAAKEIATHASGPFTLCVSAQVPIGTCDELSQLMAAVQPVHAIPVVYVPEFLRLGTAIQTFLEADRFVIGSDDREIAGRVAELYQPLARPISITGRRTAEMAKHASNAFLALSISFINQIADLCEETGADVTDVAAVMKLDKRIGPQAFLNAGLGYAGGTLGREIRALHHLGARHGVSTDLLDSVALTNERRVPRVLQRLKQLDFDLGGSRIAVLGLTYKPGTSTLRRSAALELIECLTHDGATVAAFDPLARLVEAPDLPEFEACADPMSAARGASALVLVAPWGGMAQFDFAACSQVMERAVLLDTGNYLPPAAMAEAGFTYVGVGRGSTKGNA